MLEQLYIPLCLETFSVVNKEKAKIINFLLYTYIVSNVCSIIAGNYPAYLANVIKTKPNSIKIYIANSHCIRDFKPNLVLKYILLDKNFQFNKWVFRHKKTFSTVQKHIVSNWSIVKNKSTIQNLKLVYITSYNKCNINVWLDFLYFVRKRFSLKYAIITFPFRNEIQKHYVKQSDLKKKPPSLKSVFKYDFKRIF